MHQLAFTRTHSHVGRDTSITVPVVLRSGTMFADLVASLDTGASYCLFESAYAIRLGIDMTSGVLKSVAPVDGTKGKRNLAQIVKMLQK